MFKKCDCAYCVNVGFPNLQKLEDDVFWFEIPKNGTGSIKIKYNIFSMDKSLKLKTSFDNVTTPPYVFVRNPYKRFIGTFKHYFAEDNDRFEWRGVPFFQKHGYNIFLMSMQERLDTFMNIMFEMDGNDEVHHFHPQVEFIDFVNFKETDLNIQPANKISDLLNTGWDHKSVSSEDVILSPSQKMIIQNTYDQDFELYERAIK